MIELRLDRRNALELHVERLSDRFTGLLESGQAVRRVMMLHTSLVRGSINGGIGGAMTTSDQRGSLAILCVVCTTNKC